VCFVIVTSLRIVTDGNKETTYLLTYHYWAQYTVFRTNNHLQSP